MQYSNLWGNTAPVAESLPRPTKYTQTQTPLLVHIHAHCMPGTWHSDQYMSYTHNCKTMLSCDCHVTLTSAHLQTAPLDLYLRKYGVASKRTIPSENIARYGRQILEVPHAVTAHLPPCQPH